MSVLPHQILNPNIKIGNKFKIRIAKMPNQQSKPVPAKVGIINLWLNYE